MVDMQVLPGDRVPDATRYGPGIDNGRALVAGTLEERKETIFINNNFKRYVPGLRDMVVGVIQQRSGDYYKVQLQPNSRPVKLNQLAFENATKKNKPNLVQGDVVYARVTSAERDLDVEIECYDSKTGKAAGFGQLKEGNLISVGLGYARQLLYQGHPVLEELGSKYAFELAVGMNGRVWVKGPDTRSTLEICQRILKAEEE